MNHEYSSESVDSIIRRAFGVRRNQKMRHYTALSAICIRHDDYDKLILDLNLRFDISLTRNDADTWCTVNDVHHAVINRTEKHLASPASGTSLPSYGSSMGYFR